MKSLKPLKPYLRKRWRMGVSPNAQYFFTCARPGRTGDPATKHGRVPDDLVHRWVLGLPSPNTAILSLLGRKPDGLSEYSFYSFHGGFDSPSECGNRPSLQEWLDHWHKDRSIVVCEHPTYDIYGRPIPPETMQAIASDVSRLLLAQRTVIIVDSGGATRTGEVCKYLHAKEDSSRLS
jgi:hypothetical protein